jgi:beta-aspartyl-peptidase (threonine type)
VKALEDNIFFNAGKGSVLTNKGTVEMEACIMDGRTKECGAVSGLSTVVHPVSLARRVMEDSPHVYLAFHGAEEFARDQVSLLSSSSMLACLVVPGKVF